MSSSTPTTAASAVNPHGLIFTLDDFVASAAEVEVYFHGGEVIQPLLTTLLSHIAEIYSARICFHTYIGPLFVNSITEGELSEWRPDVPAQTLLMRLYFKAGVAGPQGGFLLNEWAVKQTATQALYDVDYYEEATIFGASDEFGNYSFDEPNEMFSDSENDDEVFDGIEGVTRAPTHNDIAAFVDSLPIVDTSTITQEDLRCPFRWGDFGAQDGCEGGDVKQVQCCNRRFARGCFIHVVESSTRCPNCRRDF